MTFFLSHCFFYISYLSVFAEQMLSADSGWRMGAILIFALWGFPSLLAGALSFLLGASVFNRRFSALHTFFLSLLALLIFLAFPFAFITLSDISAFDIFKYVVMCIPSCCAAFLSAVIGSLISLSVESAEAQHPNNQSNNE